MHPPRIPTVVDRQTENFVQPERRNLGLENMVFGLPWSQGFQNTPNRGDVTNFPGGQNLGLIFDSFFWLGWVARAPRY